MIADPKPIEIQRKKIFKNVLHIIERARKKENISKSSLGVFVGGHKSSYLNYSRRNNIGINLVSDLLFHLGYTLEISAVKNKKEVTND